MKKFFIVFVLAILASCVNTSQNTISENTSQNEVMENTSKTSENTENIENTENTESEEFDLYYEYEKYIENTIAEIVKLPESERMKKVGNFEITLLEEGGYVKYIDDFNGVEIPYINLHSYQEYYFDCTYREDKTEQKCEFTKEKIFEWFAPIELEGEFEVIEGSIKNLVPVQYIFDKKNKQFLKEVHFGGYEVFRKGDKVFILSHPAFEINRTVSVFVDYAYYNDKVDETRLMGGETIKTPFMEINEVFDFEKSIFTEKGFELKDSEGKTIMKVEF